MSRRTGQSVPLSVRAGYCLPVLLLLGCHSPAETQQGTHPTALSERIEALESRQKGLEAQLDRLRREVDESTSRPAPGRADVKPAMPLPTDTISVAGLPTGGDPTAALAIIEYSDFQCPYCRRYYLETWPLIDRNYVRTGRLRYVFHHLPLGRIHPVAVGAAESAECAAR